jgi:hypothetical protein
MNIIEDDHQHDDVIQTLKGLKKVSAPANFEADLMRRINTEKYDEKKSFWWKFLLPSRLIPSAALVLSAIVVLFVINTNSGAEENPLLIPPKIREDVVASSNVQKDLEKSIQPKVKKEEVAKPRTEKKVTPQINNDVPALANNDITPQDSGISNLGITITGNNPGTNYGNPSIVSFGNRPINKRGLNYMQRNLTPQEKAQLQLLKKRWLEMMKELNK